MKKFLSVVIAAMITMACTVFPAFATSEATADTSTPDEATTVSSIKIEKLPEKLVYVFGEDANWDYDSVSLGDIMDNEFETVEDLEAFRAIEMKFDIDLTGIEVVATYADNTTANVPVEELTAKVTNPLTFGELVDIAEKYMPDDENATIDDIDFGKYLEEVTTVMTRDYIVEVEYKGAVDTYTVNISEDMSGPDYSSDYELVSYTLPEKTVYDMANEDDVYIDDWSDESGEYFYYDVMVDTTGMTATLRHKETGEMVTVNGEDISAYFFYDYGESGKLVPGVYDVEATAWTEDGSYVDFTFPITIVDSSQKADEPVTDEPSTDDATSSVSTADTATPDSDNTAIKTGTPSNVTAMLSVVLVMTVGVVLFWYKKRVTE